MNANVGLTSSDSNSFKVNVTTGWRITYESTKWSVWSLGLGYVIYACCVSQGALVGWFLSLKIWMPLSRMTFSAYLLHELVILER